MTRTVALSAPSGPRARHEESGYEVSTQDRSFPCGRYFCSTAAVLYALVLLSTTSDAAVRNSPKNAARIAVQRSVATPVEHEGVPPMLMEPSSVEGYYPLRYTGDLIEVSIGVSLERVGSGKFTILFPLSTVRAAEDDSVEQIDALDDALAGFNIGISGSADTPVPMYADDLAELMGDRSVTEYLATGTPPSRWNVLWHGLAKR